MDAQVDYKGLPFYQRIRLGRALSSYSRVQKARSALMGALTRNRWPGDLRGLEYLNAGCGPRIALKFINLDYVWRPGLQLCWDITKRLPIRDASIRGVFTEHCIDMVSLRDCAKVLSEFFRILKPNGIVRIIVADVEVWLNAYAQTRVGKPAVFPFADASRLPIEEVNHLFYGHGHRFAYDFDMMAKMLRNAGFVSIERRSFMVGADPALLIDSDPHDRLFESFYVEAAKPA